MTPTTPTPHGSIAPNGCQSVFNTFPVPVVRRAHPILPLFAGFALIATSPLRHVPVVGIACTITTRLLLLFASRFDTRMPLPTGPTPTVYGNPLSHVELKLGRNPVLAAPADT